MAKINAQKEADLKALEEMENGGIELNPPKEETLKGMDINDSQEDEEGPIQVVEDKNRPNMIDGNIILDRDELPHNGVLYPESWNFAYRSPETEEVAVFSTLNPQDQPAIMVAVDDLVRKCVTIYDANKDQVISSSEICDGHKIFFLLKLREMYLSNAPIKMESICMTCHENFDGLLFASKLKYYTLPEGLMKLYDGRVFHFKIDGIEDTINIRIPTLSTSSKLFKHLIKVYRGAQGGQKKDEGLEKFNKIFYDKVFLLYSPFLFETGNESINEIVSKFNVIKKDKNLNKAYLRIINSLSLDNMETIDDTCPHCESLEETRLTFPDWKELFLDKLYF